MARPKLIEDSVLLDLIKKYFYEECQDDAKKLKLIDITRYINQNGYPDYPSSTLRRTPAAVDYIEELKKSIRDDGYVTIASYQTIDAKALVESNRSKDTLIKAINERDCYYKKIADSAVYYLKKYDTLSKQYEEEKQNNVIMATSIKKLEAQISQYKSELKLLKADLKAHKSVVDNYIYPEIANELLAKEGALRKTDTPLKEDALAGNLITSTTNIKKVAKPQSNVIRGLFDALEEE